MTSKFLHFWHQRYNFLTLVYNDFTQNYIASYLGFIWALIQPIITLTVLSLVFHAGFKVPPIDDSGIPFVAWLTCGIVPWFYIAEALNTGATAVTSYAFLIRKVSVFRIAYLPIMRTAAAGIIHLCLLLFVVCILIFYRIFPSIYWLQILIYTPLLYLFLLGISYLTSSVTVFIPDTTSLLGVITNLGFWATPIFWHSSSLPPRWHWIFTINPIHYLVQGYRDTFINHRWIWERPALETGLFGLWICAITLIGIYTFKKLRPQFADVL